MSSLFNLPTSDSIPDPSSATDRITLEEVAPRSSSLDGAVTIEFTSSPSRWYSPSDSYLAIGCNVFSTLRLAEISERALRAVAGARVRTGTALVAGVVHRQMLDLRKVEARHILRCNNVPRASVGHLNANSDLEGACRYVERDLLQLAGGESRG